VLRGRGCPKAPSPRRRTSQACAATVGHPIAPTEFPKRRSAAALRGPRGRCRLLHAPFRWRKPVPSHARRRLPVEACPQRSSWEVGHRPRTHRPQMRPLAAANGASAPSCEPGARAVPARSKQKRIALPRGPAAQERRRSPAAGPVAARAGTRPTAERKSHGSAMRRETRAACAARQLSPHCQQRGGRQEQLAPPVSSARVASERPHQQPTARSRSATRSPRVRAQLPAGCPRRRCCLWLLWLRAPQLFPSYIPWTCLWGDLQRFCNGCAENIFFRHDLYAKCRKCSQTPYNGPSNSGRERDLVKISRCV